MGFVRTPAGRSVRATSMERVVCPWHEWAYDCKTGVNDYDENVKLAVFPVKVDGDDILIDVP
jgi:nitrite reductase/ring-hydroxylating ferredoxin subunit